MEASFGKGVPIRLPFRSNLPAGGLPGERNDFMHLTASDQESRTRSLHTLSEKLRQLVGETAAAVLFERAGAEASQALGCGHSPHLPAMPLQAGNLPCPCHNRFLDILLTLTGALTGDVIVAQIEPLVAAARGRQGPPA
jgi:hypothetical protein